VTIDVKTGTDVHVLSFRKAVKVIKPVGLFPPDKDAVSKMGSPTAAVELGPGPTTNVE
jgi:hypothetical protein